MAHIKIEQEGACTYVEVDGVRLKGVLEANVMLEPRSLPTVEVRLHMGTAGMNFADGCLKVGALDAPEALERALLAHLKGKYEGIDRLLALPVRSMGVDLDKIKAQVAAVADWSTGPYVPAAKPKAEDPMEAVRALVKKHGG